MLWWAPFSYPSNLARQFGDALALRGARAYEHLQPIARPPLVAPDSRQ